MKFNLFIILILINFHLQAQPSISEVYCYGGSHRDNFYSVQKTLDGGYISLGLTNSADYDLLDVCCPAGGNDIWIVKLDSNFAINWQHIYSYDNNPIDEMTNIFVNEDTTYTMFGTISSTGEDNICNCNHSESQDVWMVKMNKLGEIISQQCFGGSSYDLLNSVSRCSDGGYIVGSSSGSADGDVDVHYGSAFTTDAFIFKVDTAGNILWKKVIGGTGYDGAFVTGISENNVLVNLLTSSHDYDLEDIMPEDETSARVQFIFDAEGNQLKQNFIPTYNFKLKLDYPFEISTGKYVIVGSNEIDTGAFSNNHGSIDAVAGILDSNLNLIEYIQFGGSKIDNFTQFYSRDNQFYLIGSSESSDFDCQSNNGDYDAFIVKTDENFNKIWSTNFGSSLEDNISNMFIENYLKVFGYSGVESFVDGDITCGHFAADIGANNDSWSIELTNPGIGVDSNQNDVSIKIYPNPAESQILIVNNNFLNEELFLKIFSLNGQLVLTQALNDEINYVDSKSFASGMYLFSIFNLENELIKTFKVTIK